MSKEKNTVSLADELLRDTKSNIVEEESESKKKKDTKQPAGKKKPETVTIHLPLMKEDREPLFVSLNGKTYLIKRGMDVEVPVGVAKIIRRKEKAELAIIDFDEEMKAPEEL